MRSRFAAFPIYLGVATSKSNSDGSLESTSKIPLQDISMTPNVSLQIGLSNLSNVCGAFSLSSSTTSEDIGGSICVEALPSLLDPPTFFHADSPNFLNTPKQLFRRLEGFFAFRGCVADAVEGSIVTYEWVPGPSWRRPQRGARQTKFLRVRRLSQRPFAPNPALFHPRKRVRVVGNGFVVMGSSIRSKQANRVVI